MHIAIDPELLFQLNLCFAIFGGLVALLLLPDIKDDLRWLRRKQAEQNSSE
jgi:hypothetical protein